MALCKREFLAPLAVGDIFGGNAFLPVSIVVLLLPAVGVVGLVALQ